MCFQRPRRSASCSRREGQAIVHSSAEILFASDIAFGGLDGCVSQKKLDLLQFSTGGVAQARTRPTQIMRGERLDADPICAGFDNVPNHVLRKAVSPNHAVLAY